MFFLVQEINLPPPKIEPSHGPIVSLKLYLNVRILCSTIFHVSI